VCVCVCVVGRGLKTHRAEPLLHRMRHCESVSLHHRTVVLAVRRKKRQPVPGGEPCGPKSLFLHTRGSTSPRGGAGGTAQATVPQHALADMPGVVGAHIG